MFSKISSRELHTMAAALASIPDSEQRLQSQAEFHRQKAIEAELAERAAATPPLNLQREHSGTASLQNTSTFGYKDPKTGGWVTSVDNSQLLCEGRGESQPRYAHDGLSFGEFVIGQTTGVWNGRMSDYAGLQVSSDSQGGFLVPSILSSQLIDLARARTVCLRAGAKTMEMPAASEFNICTLNSDPVATWRRENVALTSTESTFGLIKMTPKTLGVLIPMSIEWIEDSIGGPAAMQAAVANAFAVKLDAAIIRGQGASEPAGILDYPSFNKTVLGGNWNYSSLLDLLEDLYDDNCPVDPNAVVLSPASEIYRRQFLDGDGNFLMQSMTPFAGIEFLHTTSCPSSEIYMGVWDQVLVGIRTQIKVEMLDAGTDNNGYNATTMLGKFLRAYMRADLAILQPKWFGVLSGVTNS